MQRKRYGAFQRTADPSLNMHTILLCCGKSCNKHWCRLNSTGTLLAQKRRHQTG
jgi:hypothetical protein